MQMGDFVILDDAKKLFILKLLHDVHRDLKLLGHGYDV